MLLAAQTGLSAAALSTFDAAYYAAQYPDVAAVCGNDEGALLRHYLDHGIDEGRKPSADGIAGDDELSLTEAQFFFRLVAGGHQQAGPLQVSQAQMHR